MELTHLPDSCTTPSWLVFSKLTEHMKILVNYIILNSHQVLFGIRKHMCGCHAKNRRCTVIWYIFLPKQGRNSMHTSSCQLLKIAIVQWPPQVQWRTVWYNSRGMFSPRSSQRWWRMVTLSQRSEAPPDRIHIVFSLCRHPPWLSSCRALCIVGRVQDIHLWQPPMLSCPVRPSWSLRRCRLRLQSLPHWMYPPAGFQQDYEGHQDDSSVPWLGLSFEFAAARSP